MLEVRKTAYAGIGPLEPGEEKFRLLASFPQRLHSIKLLLSSDTASEPQPCSGSAVQSSAPTSSHSPSPCLHDGRLRTAITSAVRKGTSIHPPRCWRPFLVPHTGAVIASSVPPCWSRSYQNVPPAGRPQLPFKRPTHLRCRRSPVPPPHGWEQKKKMKKNNTNFLSCS